MELEGRAQIYSKAVNPTVSPVASSENVNNLVVHNNIVHVYSIDDEVRFPIWMHDLYSVLVVACSGRKHQWQHSHAIRIE